ncbi:MAG: hypothetical protein ACLTKE_05975 [Coprococcus sp.]
MERIVTEDRDKWRPLQAEMLEAKLKTTQLHSSCHGRKTRCKGSIR